MGATQSHDVRLDNLHHSCFLEVLELRIYNHSNVLFLIFCRQKSTVSISKELPVHNILCLIFITKEIVK